MRACRTSSARGSRTSRSSFSGCALAFGLATRHGIAAAEEQLAAHLVADLLGGLRLPPRRRRRRGRRTALAADPLVEIAQVVLAAHLGVGDDLQHVVQFVGDGRDDLIGRHVRIDQRAHVAIVPGAADEGQPAGQPLLLHRRVEADVDDDVAGVDLVDDRAKQGGPVEPALEQRGNPGVHGPDSGTAVHPPVRDGRRRVGHDGRRLGGGDPRRHRRLRGDGGDEQTGKSTPHSTAGSRITGPPASRHPLFRTHMQDKSCRLVM